MKPIKEVYPDFGEYFGAWDYKPLLESFDYEILLQVDDDDYQGDSRILFKNDDMFGVLIFGWGSCSGCDALQACSSLEEVDDLRKNLFNGIVWENKNDMIKYLSDNEIQELKYSYHQQETQEFLLKAVTLLKELD